MPILPAEPEIFPDDLFDQPARQTVPPPSEVEHDELPRWWCLHTKPRQEKAAARYLRDRRLPHYLPQVSRDGRTPGGRTTRSVLPLFPSYLFLKGDSRQRLDAFQGGQLVTILEVEDQEQIDGELKQIHQMLSSGLPVAPEPNYPVGSRVRILGGPLMGMVGTVVRRGNRDHFAAMVHFLGRGATVELQDWQVEPVNDQ